MRSRSPRPASGRDRRSSDRDRLAIAALLSAQLCLGVAHVAALPPWEGFDEPGHFSSIQQVADRGDVPRLPEARISAVIEQYATQAPLAYATGPPFDRNGGRTYHGFFASGASVVEAGRRAVHDSPPAPRRYAPGADLNYIAQHPPLNALLLAPLYRATSGLSLGGQLLVLRLACYAMAWLALVTGVLMVARGDSHAAGARIAVVAAALWPLFMPSWFPAMARLGNDALTALLAAALWAWLATRGCRTLTSAVVVGLLLGAGAMTKAFFVPIAAVTCAWIVATAWSGGARERAAAAWRATLTATVMTAMTGWWYAGVAAVAVAGVESQRLAAAGGLRRALAERFSVTGWLDGVVGFLGQAAWSGTWSIAHPPHVLFAPLVAGLCAALALYLFGVRREPMTSSAWLPAWWLAALLAGFAYHILVHVALTGSGRGVGGYYLHVLVAPLACALGWGVAVVWRRQAGRAAACAYLGYAATFVVAVGWAQLLLFTGQLTKSAAKAYEPVAPLSAWLGVPAALGRLDVLAFPRLAVVCAVLGAGLLGAGLAAVAWPRRREVGQ